MRNVLFVLFCFKFLRENVVLCGGESQGNGTRTWNTDTRTWAGAHCTYLIDAIIAVALCRCILAMFPTLHVSDHTHWLPLAPVFSLRTFLIDWGVAIERQSPLGRQDTHEKLQHVSPREAHPDIHRSMEITSSTGHQDKIPNIGQNLPEATVLLKCPQKGLQGLLSG